MDNSQQTVFVGNLPFQTTEDQLKNTFEKFGVILEVNIPKNRDTGQARGFAFIKFEDASSAEEALALNDQDFNGRTMKVSIALGKKESRPRQGGYNNDRRGGYNNDRRGGFSNRGGRF